MALENTPFTADFTIETPISSGFPIATFEYRSVYTEVYSNLGGSPHES